VTTPVSLTAENTNQSHFSKRAHNRKAMHSSVNAKAGSQAGSRPRNLPDPRQVESTKDPSSVKAQALGGLSQNKKVQDSLDMRKNKLSMKYSLKL
jgi:hypothetical protein